MSTPSSPQVSRSYSYPLESPWHSANDMDPSRKGSVDSNNPTNSATETNSADTYDDESSESTSSSKSSINTSDKMVPPRIKHGKSPAEELKVKNRMWRASGSLVQQRVSLMLFSCVVCFYLLMTSVVISLALCPWHVPS